MADKLETGAGHGPRVHHLLKQGLVHFGVALAALCLFAACDSWHALTGSTPALALSVLTGFGAGFAVTTVFHEWSHLIGAGLSGGRFDIPQHVSFFVYDWKFEHNTVRQFYIMSIAGSVGGVLSVVLLALAVSPDTPGRVALVAGAVASFAFGSIIEWPVLRRTLSSGKPLDELSKIDRGVLLKALLGSGLAAFLACWWAA